MSEKKWKVLIVTILCIFTLFLVYTFFPVNIIPKAEYSSVNADYVLINGEEVTLNIAQTNEIVDILKQYKAHRTYNYKPTEYYEYDPVIYMVFLFRDDRYNRTTAGLALNLSNDHQFATNTNCDWDKRYKQIYCGKELMDRIMSVVSPEVQYQY